ncbi:OmpH family outer membrane protein [Paracoccus sp. Z330]|uniref:OmpH family outer membrane protein n=1 Tax=Paracoccus onchidii TaxID=3017813 RepID=A0ABT4ZHQ9_9RHOB|nr:OmpH family outer membrane protein [Paracoccus onchidii]MDB6178523.1 OmpH family outer membrane protein [Paracoccus onchidii]
MSPVYAQQVETSPVPELTDQPSQPSVRRDGDRALPTRTIQSEGQSLVDAPILTVDQERLFDESDWGQRALRELEQRGGEIAQENDRLATQLSNEEAQLTQQRSVLEPAEFRKLAEAFDSRATTIRRERAQMVQKLNAEAEADRNAFFQAALPVMGEVMQERGATAVLDRRTVFVSLDAIDITSDLIERLNQRIGDGTEDDTAPPVSSSDDN